MSYEPITHCPKCGDAHDVYQIGLCECCAEEIETARGSTDAQENLVLPEKSSVSLGVCLFSGRLATSQPAAK